jgi:hypothetical protein
MKYLCLGYHDEQLWAALPQHELDAIMRDTRAYEDSLRARGHVLSTAGLQPARQGATLRFQAGDKPTVTDGPFTETKEQLGGIMVLEASDLNHAIQLMSGMPCMRMGGSLEIRPINEELFS